MLARRLWGCLFLMVCLSVSVKSKRCPPPMDIQPCVCPPYMDPVRIQCTDQTDLDVLQEVFNRNDEPFTYFRLDDSNLLYLPADAITKKNMQKISIENSVLMTLFDRPPDENNKLVNLTVYNTKLERGFQWKQLKPLRKLYELVIIGTAVRDVWKDFEQSMSATLSSFTLADSDTRRFSPTAFSKLIDLREIGITKTRLKTPKRSMFSENSKLTTIDFSYNSIVLLPDDMFTKMPSLKYLYLTGNKMQVFSEAVFGNIQNKGLYIKVSENPISCDCKFKWLLFKRVLFRLDGQCESPSSKKGISFEDLSQDQFEYCSDVNQ